LCGIIQLVSRAPRACEEKCSQNRQAAWTAVVLLVVCLFYALSRMAPLPLGNEGGGR
jgi:hypothetical protein